MKRHECDEKKYLQIKLMYHQALGRLADADLLSESFSKQSDSDNLIRLLAFEILLKCISLIYGNVNKVHKYKDIFFSFPKPVQDRLLLSAADRMSTSADYYCIEKLLVTWGDNFVRLRYPYESYTELNEDEFHALGKRWIDSGAKLEDAKFVYYPSELSGLIHALSQEVENWLSEL